MDYLELKGIVNSAWLEFYHHLSANGFSDEQINKLDTLLDNKDCFNDVLDCVMGVNTSG